MKEVLTKKFWQDVKKTFDEAKDGPPSEVIPAPPPDPPAASSSIDARGSTDPTGESS